MFATRVAAAVAQHLPPAALGISNQLMTSFWMCGLRWRASSTDGILGPAVGVCLNILPRVLRTDRKPLRFCTWLAVLTQIRAVRDSAIKSLINTYLFYQYQR